MNRSLTFLALWSGQIAVEAFTCLLVFKNIFSFILTFFAYDWLVVKGGSREPFIAIGSIQVGVCLLAVPMCKYPPVLVRVVIDLFSLDIFGKRNRSFFARHDILKLLHLW